MKPIKIKKIIGILKVNVLDMVKWIVYLIF